MVRKRVERVIIERYLLRREVKLGRMDSMFFLLLILSIREEYVFRSAVGGAEWDLLWRSWISWFGGSR